MLALKQVDRLLLSPQDFQAAAKADHCEQEEHFGFHLFL